MSDRKALMIRKMWKDLYKIPASKDILFELSAQVVSIFGAKYTLKTFLEVILTGICKHHIEFAKRGNFFIDPAFYHMYTFSAWEARGERHGDIPSPEGNQS